MQQLHAQQMLKGGKILQQPPLHHETTGNYSHASGSHRCLQSTTLSQSAAMDE
jgi:hypothetical protein